MLYDSVDHIIPDEHALSDHEQQWGMILNKRSVFCDFTHINRRLGSKKEIRENLIKDHHW